MSTRINTLLVLAASSVGLGLAASERACADHVVTVGGENSANLVRTSYAVFFRPRIVTALVLGGGLALAGGLALTNGAVADTTGFLPAPVIPLATQPPAHLIVDLPLPEQLARGYVVVRYRAENLRIMPVYGPAALNVLPRIGHLHITVDDAPWHWLDASGEPLSINGLLPGPHQLLIELEDPTHKLIDSKTIKFEIPQRESSQR